MLYARAAALHFIAGIHISKARLRDKCGRARVGFPAVEISRLRLTPPLEMTKRKFQL